MFINELTVRNLNELDYEKYLVHWWNDWKWVAPVKDFLPDSGKGGIKQKKNLLRKEGVAYELRKH